MSDLAYQFEADLTRTIAVGLVPEGVRLDVAFEGTVVKGRLEGSAVEGIDYLLLRSDGVGVIDAHEVVTLPSGLAVSLHARGYIVPPMQLPPPEVILSPTFAWPDAELPLHGFSLARTGASEMAEMNRTAFAFEGTVNVGTKKLAVTAVYPAPIVTGAAPPHQS